MCSYDYYITLPIVNILYHVFLYRLGNVILLKCFNSLLPCFLISAAIGTSTYGATVVRKEFLFRLNRLYITEIQMKGQK